MLRPTYLGGGAGNGGMVIIPCQKKSILSQRFGANSSESMEFFCAGHMPSLIYLSTIRKYFYHQFLRMYTPTWRQLTKTTGH